MSLTLKYRPKVFGGFVGAAARQNLLRLLKFRLSRPTIDVTVDDYTQRIWEPLIIGLIAPKGGGKSTGMRLIGKGLFCTQGADGGPCGICETCASFDMQHETGWGIFDIPDKFPSRTPSTAAPDRYFFESYDFAANNKDAIRRIHQIITPNRCLSNPLTKAYPEVVLIDEAHRAQRPNQELLLTGLHGRVCSSVIFCIAEENLHKIDPALQRRMDKIFIALPEIGELVEYVRYVADQERIKIDGNLAAADLVQGVEFVTANALRMLDQALKFEATVTSDWVAKTLPIVLPPDTKGENEE